MTGKRDIEFWFSVGSTYTYLTVMRLREISESTGIVFYWRPFSVRAIMQEMSNIPFVGKPAKEKYMWTDLQRRANKYGLSFQSPVTYPLKNFDLANHIAVLAAKEGWCEEYVVSTYKNWFQEGKPAGEQENIRDSLSAIGQSVDRVISMANSAEIRNAYDDATDRARALGIFGSPSFVVNRTDLFWGDDRLEDAIEHCQ